MTNRQDILEEQLLRENIRRAINIIKDKELKKENYIRSIVRNLISEEVMYEYTALQRLAAFVEQQVGNPKRPDRDFAFKQGYIQFSSSKENRERYVEYILDLANEDFQTYDAQMEPQPLSGEFVEKGFTSDEDEDKEEEDDEVITVRVQDLEDNDGDINLTETDEDDTEEFKLGESDIDEEENSGIKKISREVYKKMGQALRNQYEPLTELGMINKPLEISGRRYEAGELSEADLFKIYFKKNILLYASRYEDEYFNKVPDENVEIDDMSRDVEEVSSDVESEEEIFKL